MTDDRLFGFAESIPGQLAMSTDDAPIRTMRDWPDAVIRQLLVRCAGPALESAKYEAQMRGWAINDA